MEQLSRAEGGAPGGRKRIEKIVKVDAITRRADDDKVLSASRDATARASSRSLRRRRNRCSPTRSSHAQGRRPVGFLIGPTGKVKRRGSALDADQDRRRSPPTRSLAASRPRRGRLAHGKPVVDAPRPRAARGIGALTAKKATSSRADVAAPGADRVRGRHHASEASCTLRPVPVRRVTGVWKRQPTHHQSRSGLRRSAGTAQRPSMRAR